MYRRQHEKALAKIVDRIAELIIKSEKDLHAEIEALKLDPDTLEKLARVQDLSSRRYQTRVLKREIKKILIASQNLLVATIVPKMDN
jgi:hypothetical protein